MTVGSYTRMAMAALVVVTSVGACRGAYGGRGVAGDRTVVDMDGRSVRLPSPERLQRAAILTSPAVQIAYILGVQPSLCGVTQAVKRWPLLAQLDTRLAQVPAVRSGAGQVNVEALLATKPDICIGSELDLRPVEAGTTIPTVRIAAGGSSAFTEQIKNEVAFLGRVFGREPRASLALAWLDASRERIAVHLAAASARAKPTIYMGFGPDHLTTFGHSTFMQEWIEAAGCRNAAEGIVTAGGKEGGLAQVSMEQVLRWAPDVLVLDEGSVEALANDPQWKSVPAVRAGRVYRLPTGIFIWNRASFESAVLLPMWLARAAYPDRFVDTPMEAEARRFYEEVFGFTFTDERLQAVLHPGRP